MAKWDLSLTPKEVEEYLDRQRTVRLATASRDGRPHVVPLWFVWVDGFLFMNSTLGNVTIKNLQANAEATGSIDDGDRYEELRGVLVHGTVEFADDDPRLDRVKRSWSQKYLGGQPVPYDRWRNRVWLRMHPERMASWDFRKIPDARARAAGRGPDRSGRALSEGP
jgi:nitroimidazol reductase NimA-like FMN-containing flavoprotein (pyridoxamine 5'-phosphate oxidase superfamily)